MSNRKKDFAPVDQGSNGVTAEASAESPKVEIPDVTTIEKWLLRDLGNSITLLTGIQQDADLLRMMSVFLQGRIRNFKNKPDPNQMDMFKQEG